MEDPADFDLDHISLFEEGSTSIPTNDNIMDILDSSVPAVGMSFDSAEDVRTFYREYGIKMGFGTRIQSSKKGKDNEIRYFMLVCSREGKYVFPLPSELMTLPTQTNECQARISVAKKDSKWYIMSVIYEHSHDLSPTKSRLFCGNRKISLSAKRTLDLNDDARVRVNKSFRSLVGAAGGYENLSFVECDVRNFLSQHRRALGKDGDGQTLLSHFSRMRELNRDFFFEIDIDDENHIRNVLWADARSRTACEHFGDIVSFDTTYLTNKYDMPFAPFVGVNHHGQSILLGCGLLSSEDTDTFIWLFKCWLRCMSYKAPFGIATDQCRAMKNVVAVVFPETRHKWCLWHIMKKIPEKLAANQDYKNMKHQMKVVVYESMTLVEFECNWEKFITSFGLTHNEWLTTIYEEL
ncbi:protein FAR-RED IMPAIRED RESPONSE 1-like [Phaseolus vulgaris]|uniref:protein FAR-RED IMPAIRED RESPONSE 1-like n=1 Tax=Phaseolus vulgaris TaxID=3885 RepID=UPI0035CA123D